METAAHTVAGDPSPTRQGSLFFQVGGVLLCADQAD